MKKTAFLFLTLSVALLSLTDCSSNEKKANALIKDFFNSTLDDMSSYEPIETSIDTAYELPSNNFQLVLLAYQADECFNKVDDYMKDAKWAHNSMRLWRGLSSKEYNEAKRDFLSSLQKQADTYQKYMNIADTIRAKVVAMDSSFVIGWRINHTFRAKNERGISHLSHSVFITDPKFSKVLCVLDYDDKSCLDALSRLNYIINEDPEDDKEILAKINLAIESNK